MSNQDFFPTENRMTVDDLQAPYQEPDVSDLSLSEQTNQKKKSLQNKTKHILSRYINAYAQYETSEDTVTKAKFNNIANQLKQQLDSVESQTNTRIQKDKSHIDNLKSTLYEQSNNINIINKNQELLNGLITSKTYENNTQTDKLTTSNELLNHTRISYYASIILLSFFILVFFYLSIKFSISMNQEVFAFNIPWLK